MPAVAEMHNEILHLRALYEETTPPRAGLANNVGCLLLARGETNEALTWLKRATELEPTTWEFHQNLAQAELQLGNPEAALRSLWNALEAAPGNMDALLPLLNALFARGAIAEATDALDKFLESASLNVVTRAALRNLLNAHRTLIWSSPRLLVIWSKLENQLGMTPAACELIERLLEICPNHVEGWRERGFLKAGGGQLEEAIVCMRRVTELDASDWAAWNDAGCCLRTLGRHAEAREWMRHAVANAPERAVLHANLALIDFELNDYEACASHLADAFARDPNNPEALHTQAMLLSATGRHREAELLDREALAAKPDYPAARLGLALTFLTLGRLREGFSAYESRWVGSDRAEQQKQPTLGRPQWHGQAMLPGACIAILPEQGFGDQLQFARFVPKLLDHFHRVLWQVPQELLGLFQASFSSERLQLVSAIDANLARSVDVELPLLSLALVLEIDLVDLPGPMPYLAPLPARVEHWRTRLDSFDGLKVGIAWQGRPTLSKSALRNCPVESFATLAMPGVQLVSLQRDADFPDSGRALPWGRECTDFADTAALVSNLDLVISVDTALVHLAGGLGVPVWMLNRLGSEWRWMDGREDSPWYPSMRIFNQMEFKDWAPTIASVGCALEAVVVGATVAGESPPPFQSVSEVNAIDQEQQSNRQIDTRHGTLRFNRHDLYVGRSLEQYGEYSEGEVELFRQLVSPGDVVVEAGANIGALTVPLSKFVGSKGHVYAFEPQPLMFQTLCTNVALNDCHNVVAKKLGLGRSMTRMSTPRVDPNQPNNFGGLSLLQHGEGEAVEVVTIDSLELARCRLIKADVEGMEEDVISGALKTIARCRPLLYLENDRPEHSSALLRFLMDLNYRIWWHCPPLFNPDNFFQNPNNLFPNLASINIFCQPAESIHPVQGMREVIMANEAP
jgi:FkbM family methyltransferase